MHAVRPGIPAGDVGIAPLRAQPRSMSARLVRNGGSERSVRLIVHHRRGGVPSVRFEEAIEHALRATGRPAPQDRGHGRAGGQGRARRPSLAEAALGRSGGLAGRGRALNTFMEPPDLSLPAVMARAAPCYGRSGPDFFSMSADGLLDRIEIHPRSRVLDVGCGPGTFASALIRRGLDAALLVCTDPVLPMLAEARALLSRDGQPAPVAAMTGERLAVRDAQFDVVICASAIHQIPDAGRAVGEMVRALRPGGVIALSVFDGRDPRWAGLGALYGRFVPPLPPGHGYDAAALHRLLDRAGTVGTTTDRQPLDVTFRDAEEWLASAWSHGERRALEAMSRQDYREFVRLLPSALEPARDPDGGLHWHPAAVYAWGRRSR